MRQTGFDFLKNFNREFGGGLLNGKRKSARPLSTKAPIHMVLKSTESSWFRPGHRELEKILCDHAKRYKIRIYRITFNWSHAHIVLKLPTRASYRDFKKTVAAAIVAYLSKQTGKCLKGLFDLRPYTRILTLALPIF
jgi:hypothetical protein